jgi:late competence protein required for DNA uptake (superfamily II DNA/RNA helicase)
MKKYCKICGQYLGDTVNCIDAQGNEINYFSIIAMRYCRPCSQMRRAQSLTLNLYNYKQRQKQLRKAEKTKLQLLEEQNELLRRKNIELRNELDNLKY